MRLLPKLKESGWTDVNAHVIDFRKPAATALWIETCTNATATGNVDGCFADFCSWGLDDAEYPGFSAAHNAAVNSLSKAMGPGGLAIGNNCEHDAKTGSLTNWSTPSAVFIEGFGNNLIVANSGRDVPIFITIITDLFDFRFFNIICIRKNLAVNP